MFEESKRVIKLAVQCVPGGINEVADAVGLSYEAVRKWTHKGLPRTEWTGETNYSAIIATLQDRYTEAQIKGQEPVKAV